MKVLSFIVEYNPFHNGHLYHLNESLINTNASHSIALMSSSFVQRGEPAIIDKWARAKMAVKNGVDLVLELPYIYSCQSAELFALGSMKLLDSLQVVNYLSFGSEVNDLEVLDLLAQVLNDEPKLYKDYLKNFLSLGMSYAKARSKALEQYLKKMKFKDYNKMNEILKGSNNILAIEYLKALKKLNSKIMPYTLERIGPNYNDYKYLNNIASATGIRKLLLNGNFGDVKKLVPYDTYSVLMDFFEKYQNFNELNNYTLILRYLSLINGRIGLTEILDVREGLENRIVEKLITGTNINEILESMATKRYPITRIQRIFIHLLTNLHHPTIKSLYSDNPQYIRVLAFNKKGTEILRKIKEVSNVNIITKYADYISLNNQHINMFLNYEEKATNLYFLGLNPIYYKHNLDFYTGPYME